MLLPALFGGVDFVVASLCTPLITACSIAGGIGGGGLLVPLYSVVLGLAVLVENSRTEELRTIQPSAPPQRQITNSGRPPAWASLSQSLVGQPFCQSMAGDVAGRSHTGLVSRIGLGPKAAVPVSLAAISGTALSNLAFSATDRHPSRARPLIDYTTAVSMQVCTCGSGRVYA